MCSCFAMGLLHLHSQSNPQVFPWSRSFLKRCDIRFVTKMTCQLVRLVDSSTALGINFPHYLHDRLRWRPYNNRNLCASNNCGEQYTPRQPRQPHVVELTRACGKLESGRPLHRGRFRPFALPWAGNN